MPRAGCSMSSRGARGFSLIELLAAIAVLSVVSVMAVQALSVTVTQRRVLEQADSEVKALSWTLTLLRQDLQAALPMPFEPSYGPPEAAFDAPGGESRFALSISGHPRLPEEAGVGFARVSWNLDPTSGALTRRITPVLHPRTTGMDGSEHVLLTGVTAFSIEAIGENVTSTGDLDDLPGGFDVRLVTERHGPLTIRVAR